MNFLISPIRREHNPEEWEQLNNALIQKSAGMPGIGMTFSAFGFEWTAMQDNKVVFFVRSSSNSGFDSHYNGVSF